MYKHHNGPYRLMRYSCGDEETNIENKEQNIDYYQKFQNIVLRNITNAPMVNIVICDCTYTYIRVLCKLERL